MAAAADLSQQKQQHGQQSEPYLPPGFRFHPTDEELVSYYLTKKVLDSSFAVRAIAEVDLNRCEPWDLPEKAKMGEKEWYFFSLRDRKYPTGMRTNRATDAGYWKATGKDRDVVAQHRPPHQLVGMKKTLVFYRGRAPKGEKTNWIMHEYRMEGDAAHAPRVAKDEWVVCRIFQKSSGGKRSFDFSDARMQALGSFALNDAPLPVLDNSPNPTVTDDGTCTDCETCAGTEPMSCYNCVPDFHPNSNNSNREPMSWVAQPGMDAAILHEAGALNHSNGGNSMLAKAYPMFDSYEKSMSMSRFSQALQSAAMATTGLVNQGAGSFRHGLRPKAEPASLCDGDDEAQSAQRVGLDYSTWPQGFYQSDDAPEATAAAADLSSLCSGENVHLFNFKYRVSDVAAPVDASLAGHELLWAY